MSTSSTPSGAPPRGLRAIAAGVVARLPVRAQADVNRFMRDPVQTQRSLLQSLVQRAAETEWGRRYGFGDIACAPDVVEAYRSRVPLHDYEDIRDDVHRIRRGTPNVTWPGVFRHFAVSSGTTSAGKIIPVSTETLGKNRRFGAALGLNYLARTGHFDILTGKYLTLPGRIEEDPEYPGTFIGEISGLVAEHAASLFKSRIQAVPNDVLFLSDWKEKLRAIAERTAEMDIRVVVMAPTWAINLFQELIRVKRERSGSRIETIGELWPGLRMFVSGGVPLRSYRTFLEETIGLPHLDFAESYGASEGFFSFQNGEDPAMLLHLNNGVFFEFVRMDEMDQPDPRRYVIGEVETGVRYALFVTTCSGLWSYGIGDVVRFTETAPYRILVAGRTNEMIDLYGESRLRGRGRRRPARSL